MGCQGGKHGLIARAVKRNPVRIPRQPLGIAPVGIQVIIDLIDIVGHIDQLAAGSIRCRHDIERIVEFVLSAILAGIERLPQACARIAGDADGEQLHRAVIN